MAKETIVSNAGDIAASTLVALQTDATVARVAAVAAEQLPQTTLGLHHTLHGRLLEQPPGKALDAGGVAQTRAVEQPEGDTHRQASGGGRTFCG